MAMSATTARDTTAGFTSAPGARMETSIDETIQAHAHLGKNVAAFYRPPTTTDLDWTNIKQTYALAGYTVADVPVGDGTFMPAAEAFELQWPEANNVLIR